MQRQVFSRGPAELGIVDGRPTVRGECDLSNADELESWLTSFGTAAIDVDLRGVTFFGATALRVFLAAAQRNPNMRIVEPSAIVRRVLQLTGTTGCLVDGTSFAYDTVGKNGSLA